MKNTEKEKEIIESEDRTWLEAFGSVLALYRDPLEPHYGFLKSGYVTQYESGLKIDFTLWPVEILQRVVADPELAVEFDAGYLVLLDKDHLTDGLKPPTYKAYIPTPPTETEYQTVWEAMFRTVALFRKVAIEVGDRLGYAYPYDLDRRAVAYLQKVKNL